MIADLYATINQLISSIRSKGFDPKYVVLSPDAYLLFLDSLTYRYFPTLRDSDVPLYKGLTLIVDPTLDWNEIKVLPGPTAVALRGTTLQVTDFFSR